MEENENEIEEYVTVTVMRHGDQKWTASTHGEGGRYLHPASAVGMGKSGHNALSELAEKWRRAGFLD